MLTLAELIF